MSLTGWLLYPVTAVVHLFLYTNPRWLTATVVGLVVFVILMALVPSAFDIFNIGSRVARPLCAYLGGLLTTGLTLTLIAKKSTP